LDQINQGFHCTISPGSNNGEPCAADLAIEGAEQRTRSSAIVTGASVTAAYSGPGGIIV
jgi:hypothetical protein